MTTQQSRNAARSAAPLQIEEDGGLATLMGTQNVTLAREAALKEAALLQAARDVLQTAFADESRSQASTELSQMRYSGIAIGLAGTGMAAYLALTQWQRFTLAYQGPLGLAVGIIVGAVLIAPFIGGFLLSRADDLDY